MFVDRSVIVVAMLLFAAIAWAVISGKLLVPAVFGTFPVIAALILGYDVDEIGTFIMNGLDSTYKTVALFIFSVAYFSTLSDVGIFDVLISKVIKKMGNRIHIVFLMTIFVAFVSHMGGIGVTTALVTIPMMRPFYDKLKIPRTYLLLWLTLSSGIANSFPWTPCGLRLATSIGIDPIALWRQMIPMQVCAMIATIILCLLLAKGEERKGIGVSDEEFRQLLDTATGEAKLSVSRGVAIFDVVFTVILLAVLLTGVLSTNVAFIIATVMILPVNYRNVKVQMSKIKEFGKNSIYCAMLMFSLSVMVGINAGAGLTAALGTALMSVAPASIVKAVLLIIALIIFPLATFLGIDSVLLIIPPLLVSMTAGIGHIPMQVALVCAIGGSLSGGCSLTSSGAYLSLGLADVSMGEHLKKTFIWGWMISLVMAAVGVIAGTIPF